MAGEFGAGLDAPGREAVQLGTTAAAYGAEGDCAEAAVFENQGEDPRADHLAGVDDQDLSPSKVGNRGPAEGGTRLIRRPFRFNESILSRMHRRSLCVPAALQGRLP